MSAYLEQENQIKALADSIKEEPYLLFLGRGANYPTALEAALKLKEVSYIQCEGFAAAEMKHGPIALIRAGTPVIVICPRDHLQEKTLSAMEEVKARGARVIAIANPDDERVAEVADQVIEIPVTHDMLTPFLSILPLQLLAYHAAVLLELDVDKPRNLAKSVTVE
jgi:glucosamine--fructose-6-phosphate aminotransferase (isomerizing)